MDTEFTNERRAVLIFNPKAGRGASGASRAVERFCERVRAGGVSVEVMPTAGPNDAVRLAREATAAGATDVVVRGGDGTVHEAIQGLACSSQGLVSASARLIAWPAGTANVLARQLGIPSARAEAAAVF